MSGEYTVLITRRDTECIASISELCIAESGTTPQEALSAALQAEENVRKTLREQKIPLPPSATLLNPFPKTTRWIARRVPFLAKAAAGYALVACITGGLLALAFPSVRSKVESYILSEKAATDAGKVLSRLGISVCLEKQR